MVYVLSKYNITLGLYGPDCCRFDIRCADTGRQIRGRPPTCSRRRFGRTVRRRTGANSRSTETSGPAPSSWPRRSTADNQTDNASDATIEADPSTPQSLLQRRTQVLLRVYYRGGSKYINFHWKPDIDDNRSQALFRFGNWTFITQLSVHFTTRSTAPHINRAMMMETIYIYIYI